MNLEDYVITIRFDKSMEPYFTVTKKGEPHKCNDEELRVVSKALDVIRRRIDFITGDHESRFKQANMETNNKCKHLRTDDNCKWCDLGYMLQCDRCRELKGNEDEE